jgi:hypothetical protein
MTTAATTMGREFERKALSRLVAVLLLLAFGFQSYIAQTHFHDMAAKGPVAAVHHSGHDKSPLQNSPLDCSFCQMLTHAGSILMPDASFLLPAAYGMKMAAPYYLRFGTGTTANHSWQSRAPPSI